MKNSKGLTQTAGMKEIFMTLIVFLITIPLSLKLAAQSVPDKVEVDINAGGETAWYGQPWIWAIGVAIFIIIIVAITRNGNKNA